MTEDLESREIKIQKSVCWNVGMGKEAGKGAEGGGGGGGRGGVRGEGSALFKCHRVYINTTEQITELLNSEEMEMYIMFR